jgi:hypothetical protein
MAQGPNGTYGTGQAFDLAALGDALSRSALGELVACFDPLRPGQAAWHRYRGQVPIEIRPLVDFFLLNRPVECDALPQNIRDLVPDMVRLGIATEDNRQAWMAHGLVALPVFGRWLLCQPPGPNPEFYFGDDSLGLLTRILPRAGGRCLDLCAGPGLLALHSAGVAGCVTAVESDPEAARLARFNVTLNRLSHRVEVLQGDLFEPVRGRRFDTITANPPMLPYPSNLAGPSIGHGGCDGFRVTRRILAGIPDALSETGTAQIIGTCLSDGATPIGIDQLQAAAEKRLCLTLTILSHHGLSAADPFFGRLIATIAAISGEKEEIVRKSYSVMVARAHASHLCNFFIHAVHGGSQLRIIDVARRNRSGHWFTRG